MQAAACPSSCTLQGFALLLLLPCPCASPQAHPFAVECECITTQLGAGHAACDSCPCICLCMRAQVLFIKDSLAIISGLNADAPLGTKLSFVTGGTG